MQGGGGRLNPLCTYHKTPVMPLGSSTLPSLYFKHESAGYIAVINAITHMHVSARMCNILHVNEAGFVERPSVGEDARNQTRVVYTDQAQPIMCLQGQNKVANKPVKSALNKIVYTVCMPA